jgi:hypothetical protein
MLDLLFSDEFSDYRKVEIAQGAGFLANTLWADEVNKDYLKGALDMLRFIIRIPMDYAVTEEAQENMKTLVARDLGIVEGMILKKYVGGE